MPFCRRGLGGSDFPVGVRGRSEDDFLNLTAGVDGMPKCVAPTTVRGLFLPRGRVMAGVGHVASNPPRAAMASEADCDRDFRFRIRFTRAMVTFPPIQPLREVGEVEEGECLPG